MNIPTYIYLFYTLNLSLVACSQFILISNSLALEVR